MSQIVVVFESSILVLVHLSINLIGSTTSVVEDTFSCVHETFCETMGITVQARFEVRAPFNFPLRNWLWDHVTFLVQNKQ